jgi:hypothetical protein
MESARMVLDMATETLSYSQWALLSRLVIAASFRSPLSNQIFVAGRRFPQQGLLMLCNPKLIPKGGELVHLLLDINREVTMKIDQILSANVPLHGRIFRRYNLC